MMKRMNLKWMSALLFPLLTTNVAAQTADDIEWLNDGDGRYILINETNFPDAAFRNFLLQDNSGTSMGTYGMDGKLMKWELDNVTTLTLSYYGIESLEGIRFFYNLQNLYVNNNQLTVLDLSKNPNIATLNISDNPLEELNLSGCSNLAWGTDIFTLNNVATVKKADFSGCTSLSTLMLNGRFPYLEELSLSGCTALTEFSYTPEGGSKRQLQKLDVTGCSNLWKLRVPYNQLDSISVAGCVNLTELDLSYNPFGSVDLSGCTSLSSFYYYGGYETDYNGDGLYVTSTLVELNLEGCTNLTRVEVYNSALKKLNLKDCTKLAKLFVSDNALEELNMTNCTTFANFSSENTSFTGSEATLKVANFTGCNFTNLYLNSRFYNLESLIIDGCTQLTSLDYSNYSSNQNNGCLKYFSAAGCSNINSITVKNHHLEEVWFSDCPQLYGNLAFNGTYVDELKRLTILNCPVNLTSFTEYSGLESLKLGAMNNLSELAFSNGKLKELILIDCPYLTQLNMSDNQLENVSFEGTTTALRNVWLRNNKLTELDVTNQPNLVWLYATNNLLREIDMTGNPNLTTLELSKNLLETIDLSRNTKLVELYVATNLLSDLDLDNNLLLEKVNCTENFLDQADVSRLTKLKSVLASRCGLLNNFNVVNHPDLEILMMNGGHYERTYERDGETITKRRDPSMRIVEVDTQHMTKLRQLLCEQELLTELDLTNNPNITFVELTNNRLLTLDMSHVTLKDRPEWKQVSDFGSQTSVENVEIVTDGSNQFVGIYLPNGGDAARLSNLKLDGVAVTTDGIRTVGEKQYLVLSTEKKDVDFYGKTLTYTYDTGVNWDTTYGPTNNQGTTMDVTVTTYPYVMYVNPATRVDGSSEFYSGTLYLDYDAVVPAGVKAYVATGVLDKEKIRLSGEKVSAEDLLDLQLVAEEGQVVPAGTALYIKSETQDGLFAWHKNTETVFDGWYKDFEQSTDSLDVFHLLVEEQNPIAPVTIPEGNILQGTATALAVEPNTVLTLGREKSRGTGQVGFWNFTGNTIAAHRCYIPKSVLDEAGGEIKGFGFYFGDETATGIDAATTDKVRTTSIYDLQGRRVTTPTKGIYIVNGKKVYVK